MKETSKKTADSKGVKLTEKQKAFCDYYVETLNATESALRAGYSKKTAMVIGSENLKKPYIIEYIKKILDGKDEKRIASQDEVLEYLTQVMRGEIVEEKIMSTMDGYEKVEKKLDIKDRTKAAELLGKRYAIFTDKLEHVGIQQVQIVDDIS